MNWLIGCLIVAYYTPTATTGRHGLMGDIHNVAYQPFHRDDTANIIVYLSTCNKALLFR